MEKITYKITDKNGIHARPAGLIVQAAKKYKADITLTVGGKTADCKKLFQLMQLGVKMGEEITVTAEGVDGDAALEEIEATMRSANL